MNGFQIFVIRAILGAAIAMVLTRMFFGRTELVYIAGLAVILVGLAYVQEYFRKRFASKKQGASTADERQ